MKASDLHKLSDSDLITQLQAFQTQVAATPAVFGLGAPDEVAMQAAIDSLQDKVTGLAAVRAQTDSILALRDISRDALIDLARAQFRTARAKPGITSDALASANLDLYETSNTKSPAPSTAPVAMIDYAKLCHIINFRDAANPNSSAKPKGMLGAEIWVKLGDTPPVDESECTFIALDTATPYTVMYGGADGGKKAHYLLRWMSKSGEKGVWSEVVTATVNA